MIHKQSHKPVQAGIGDVWTDDVSFKRVLSRGGAWENVNLGSLHPDEVNHEQQEQTARAKARRESGEVSIGAGESASRDGNDGEALSESGGFREEDPALIPAEDIDAPIGSGLSTSTGRIDSPNPDGVALFDHPGVRPVGFPASVGLEDALEGEGIDGTGSPVV